jgi:hypothetical protein
MGKKSISGSGSGTNIPDHISESLEHFFGLKNLNSLVQIWNLFGPGSGIEKFGSGMFIPDLQHCKKHMTLKIMTWQGAPSRMDERPRAGRCPAGCRRRSSPPAATPAPGGASHASAPPTTDMIMPTHVKKQNSEDF